MLFKIVGARSVNVKIYGDGIHSIGVGRAKEDLKIVDNSLEWIPTLVNAVKAKIQNGQSMRVHLGEMAANAYTLQLSSDCLDWFFTLPKGLGSNPSSLN